MLRRIFVLFLFACATAKAEWVVEKTERFQTASPAVTRVATTVRDTNTGETVRLQMALFDSKRASLKLIDQPDEPRVELSEAMSRADCVAGVNGGYFHPDYRAVGMLMTGGKTIALLQKARLLSGVVAIEGSALRVLRTGEITSTKKWTEARQAGPFLVDKSRPVTGLERTRSARRTFVASSGRQSGALGYASSVTLADLGRILATPGIAGEFIVQRALNLDGGSSTAFWCTTVSGEPVSVPEYKTVRDFIGIRAR